jgi:hypothetical protein
LPIDSGKLLPRVGGRLTEALMQRTSQAGEVGAEPDEIFHCVGAWLVPARFVMSWRPASCYQFADVRHAGLSHGSNRSETAPPGPAATRLNDLDFGG